MKTFSKIFFELRWSVILLAVNLSPLTTIILYHIERNLSRVLRNFLFVILYKVWRRKICHFVQIPQNGAGWPPARRREKRGRLLTLNFNSMQCLYELVLCVAENLCVFLQWTIITIYIAAFNVCARVKHYIFYCIVYFGF